MSADYPSFDRPKVLVVEDNAGVRQVSVGLLNLLNCEGLEAEDGLSALELLDTGRRVDLLFTDIVMPGRMNGFRLAELAREHRPGLKVLFTSGYSWEALPFSDPAFADSTVLSKPYGLAQLQACLQHLLPGIAAPASEAGLGGQMGGSAGKGA
jgi:CheY-like chemotaxis protein